MCLIDEKWESDFTLLGIFEGMLPLLLEELNPSHPMNSHAKNTFNKNRAEFERLAELHSGLKKDDSDSEKKQ